MTSLLGVSPPLPDCKWLLISCRHLVHTEWESEGRVGDWLHGVISVIYSKLVFLHICSSLKFCKWKYSSLLYEFVFAVKVQLSLGSESLNHVKAFADPRLLCTPSPKCKFWEKGIERKVGMKRRIHQKDMKLWKEIIHSDIIPIDHHIGNFNQSRLGQYREA